MARFSLIMKTLLASGVQIVDALDIAKRTVGNLVYEKEIGRAKDLIVGGVPISKALESEYIPDITNNMIAIGEETGSVTTMLGTVSDYYMVELKDKLDALSAAIEPLVTVVLGIFISLFVMSIFVPMFKMISLVGN
jgi:type IV pilus assembly protein PilC